MAERSPRKLDRLDYALSHPLADPHADLRPYLATRRHKTGLIIQSILAVDR